MSKTIDEDGNPLTYKALYYHHQGKYEEKCESLQDAYEYLVWGEDDGYLSGIGIEGPDGEIAMSGKVFHAAYCNGVKVEDLVTWVDSYTMKEIEQ